MPNLSDFQETFQSAIRLPGIDYLPVFCPVAMFRPAMALPISLRAEGQSAMPRVFKLGQKIFGQL